MLIEDDVCCDAMKERVFGTYYDPVVEYDEVYRCYSYILKNGDIDNLIFCPWCGVKLPVKLDPYYTIKREYGADYVKCYLDEGYKELSPEVQKEFESDEWWKKRNIGPDDPGF